MPPLDSTDQEDDRPLTRREAVKQLPMAKEGADAPHDPNLTAGNTETEPAPAPEITLGTVREKYPQYQDLSDEQLVQGLHKKFYSDMPFDDFAKKVGFGSVPKLPTAARAAPAADNEDPTGAAADKGWVPDAAHQRTVADRLRGASDSNSAEPIAAEQGMVPEPTQSAPLLSGAVAPIVQAAKEGFGDEPVGMGEKLEGALRDWGIMPQPGAGPQPLRQVNEAMLKPLVGALDLVARGGAAAFRAAQQSLVEAGDAIGEPRLGRELAGYMESRLGDPMGVPGPRIADAARYELGRIQAARAPVAMPEVRSAAEEMQSAAAERPTPEPGTPASVQQNIEAGRQAAAEVRQERQPQPTQTVSPMLNRMVEEAQQRPTPEQAATAEMQGDNIPTLTVTPQPVAGFQTAKGSTYQVHEDGTTTRDKSFHPEHGAADVGPQPRSETTFFVTPEQANALAEFQTQGGPGKAIVPLGDGRFGVGYTDGPQAGKVERRTVVMPQRAPSVGLVPVELWNGGAKAHFGNPITEVTPRANTAPATPESVSGGYTLLDPSELHLSPEQFQYKAADTRGITGALLGTNRWEPALANPITAWRGEDGTLYVVNGHQRTDLAQRAQAAGQPDVRIPARVFREEDGYTPEYMRTLGAFQNIAEGSGTALDAAKVIRGRASLPEDMRLPDLPPRSQLVQQANGLAALDDRAFGMVESGAVEPAHAALVGAAIADPAEQIAALDALARAHPPTIEQARIMVQDIRNSGFLQGAQTTLFGDEAMASSLFPERARILDNAMRTLRRQRGVFKAAVEGEETLTAAGNALSREGNIAGKTANERLLDRLSDDATRRGELSDALTAAARDLAEGKPVGSVTSRFLAEARRLEQRGPEARVQPGDLPGGVGPEAEGQEGIAFARRAPKPPAAGAPLFGEVAPEEAAKRQAEPTIRNDPRQVDMFGTTDAAVQAQAARDQAGRGALLPKGEQRPADRGLFAPKTEEEPGLFARREEAKPERIAGTWPNGQSYEMHVNPSSDGLASLLRKSRDGVLRGAVRGSDFAVADATKMIHADMTRALANEAHPMAERGGRGVQDLMIRSLPEASRDTTRIGDMNVMVTDSHGNYVGPRDWPSSLQRALGREAFARRAGEAQGTVNEEAKARLAAGAQRMVRALGIEDRVGVRLVDKLADAAGNAADAHYWRGLVTLAMDTRPEEIGAKLFHETVHALMDRDLGLLNDTQRNTLLNAADRWLARGDNMEGLARSGYSPAEMREEAVARMGEDALKRGIKPPAAYQRMTNFIGRVGNWLRREGYRTADDVFDSIMSRGVDRGEGAPGEGGEAFARRPQAVAPQEGERQRGPVGRMVARVGEATREVGRSIADGMAPMQGGTTRSQAFAANFANSLRRVQFKFTEIDRHITKNFTPDDRRAMGQALDRQSVFEQTNRGMSPEEQVAARAEFDASGDGVARLNPKQRDVVEALNVLSQDTWRQMQERGLVAPNAVGIPYYFPRQILAFTEREGFTLPRGGEGSGGRGMDERGRNLTTQGPMRREHLTPEETEAAAKAKLGQNVAILNDIRSLPARLAFSQRAVVGVDLMNALEKVGKETGVDLVLHGDLPGLVKPGDYFTLSDHPAFRRWTGNGWRAVHIAEEFRGPLDAVLTKPSKTWYRAAMQMKSGVMNAIMFSPFIHLQVEVGRSLPIMLMSDPSLLRVAPRGSGVTGIPIPYVGTLTLKMMRDGSRVRRDPAYMDTAVRDGIAPLGQAGGWHTDPVSIADQANVEGRNAFLRTLGNWRDAVANGAGKVGGEMLHDIIQHPHQTLLWDQVFNLQMGIYDSLKSSWTPKYGDEVAGTMAAHIANRYAGALPPEHLSRSANMAANLLLFSRSFTLGNLGVMKDMFNGAPAHIRSRIEQMAGPEMAKSATGALRRKAIAAFTMDIGMYALGINLAQVGLQTLWQAGKQGVSYATAAQQQYEDWLDQAKSALTSAAKSPLDAFGILPTYWNEPGKQGRVHIGEDSEGRGIYGRLPFGKVGEEFIGYWTHPGDMVMSKLNPMLRPIMELAIGYTTLGERLLPPDRHTIGDYITTARAAVQHIVEGLGPTQTIKGAAELYRYFRDGKSGVDPFVSAAKVVGPATGLMTVSQGFPGGPAVGEMHMEDERQRYAVRQALPAIRDMMRKGDEAGATAEMDRLNVPLQLQKYYWGQVETPGMTKGAGKRLQSAPPQIQERVQRHERP